MIKQPQVISKGPILNTIWFYLVFKKLSFKYKWHYLKHEEKKIEFQETQEGEARQAGRNVSFLFVLFLISGL